MQLNYALTIRSIIIYVIGISIKLTMANVQAQRIDVVIYQGKVIINNGDGKKGECVCR